MRCFNSRAPRGARPLTRVQVAPYHGFQFTCPSRSTTASAVPFHRHLKFQFTCPSRSTTYTARCSMTREAVSIHVPLAEHDETGKSLVAVVNVSIHVPLAEHDHYRRPLSSSGYQFQFTCPSRSTTHCKHCPDSAPYVSIHVPLAEHDTNYERRFARCLVSIHVPLAEHDLTGNSVYVI